MAGGGWEKGSYDMLLKRIRFQTLGQFLVNSAIMGRGHKQSDKEF